MNTKDTTEVAEGPLSKRVQRPPRLFAAIDAWFFGIIALVVVSGAFVPFLPFILAGLALATPLRRSRWRVVTVLLVGVVLGLLFIAPFLIDPFDLNLIEQGPVRTAR